MYRYPQGYHFIWIQKGFTFVRGHRKTIDTKQVIMNDNQWTEVRKECEVDAAGNYVIKKITLEKVSSGKEKIGKKEIIDYSIKIIGILSILMPLFLFYKQQGAERQKQDRLQKFNTYSAAMVDLHSFSKEKPFTESFEKQADRIIFESYPKILFLNDKAVIDEFSTIKSVLDYTHFADDIFKRLAKTDSLIEYFYTKDSSNFSHYSTRFDTSGIKDDYYFIEAQKDKLDKFKSSAIPLLKYSAGQIDSLMNTIHNLIYNAQSKYLRDSVMNYGDFTLPIMVSYYRETNARKYIEDYSLFIAEKVRILDSLMIQSAKAK